MVDSQQKKCDRCRSRMGLTVLFLVAFANLAEAQTSYSQLNISPYPLLKTLNGSIQEKNVTAEKLSDDKEKYCLKPECIHTASRVMNYMDASLDPCDNFYEFACGQYMSDQEISDIYINNKLSIEEDIKHKVKRILEQDLKPTEPKYVKLMKTFYRNCMNTAGDLKGFSSKMAVDFITEINGWSYLNNSPMNNESFHWEQYLAKIMEKITFFQSFFFESSLIIDSKNSSNIVFLVHQPLNLAPSDFSSFKYLLPELTKRNVPFEDLFVKIQEIEKMLINISIPEEERQWNSFDRMTVKELEGNYSNILWREIFNGIRISAEVKDDDIVQVSDRSFLKKFNEHINNISKRDQAIYLMWTAMKDFLEADDLQISKKKEMWEQCFEQTRKSFMTNLGALYVKNYLNKENDDKNMEKLNTNIFHQFNSTIKNANWLDQKTKDYALEKLSSIYAERQKIFQISDDKEIDEFYTNLEITEGNFSETRFNITKFNHKLISNYSRFHVDKSSLFTRYDATFIVVYHIVTLNGFGISPGIFQGIFFNENRPMYMNYGAIGSIVGQELIHGFDSYGKHYDKDANYNDWWEPTSEKQYDEKSQCFISQYQGYKDEASNLNVNGTRTLGQNIVDNEGLKISYSAYQKWVKDHGSEPLLPGLNYTQSQLFWISFAQAYCEKASPEYRKSSITSDLISPSEFRVIGSLSNRPEFAKDFQCPVGSKMNPKTKCSVW